MALLDLVKKSSNKNNLVTMTPSQQLSAANPYKNPAYYESPMQGFLSALGFRTGADAWRENMAVQASEYDAQMALKQYDEQYNLPINQVARMRAAGLNPDLSGGDGISPGEAAKPGDDPSTPMQSVGDEGKLMEFANGVLSCVSMAAGIAGTIENVRGAHLDNVLKSITGEQEMSEYASKIFPFLLPETPNDVIGSDGEFVDNAYSGFLGRAQLFAGQLPKSLQNKFIKQVSAFWNSAPGSANAYKQWRDNMMSRKGYEVDSRTNFSWDSDEMSIIADELSKLASKAEKQGLRSDGAEQKYNADYYENLSGEAAAAAENEESRANEANFGIQAELRGALNNMINRIKGDSDKKKKKGNTLGIDLLLTTLSMLQLYLSSNGVPSARRSSSSSSVSDRYPSYDPRNRVPQSVLDF